MYLHRVRPSFFTSCLFIIPKCQTLCVCVYFINYNNENKTKSYPIYANTDFCNNNVGYSNAMPPRIYVICEPKHQKATHATAGPKARANAPSDRKMPKIVPF